MTLRKLTAGAVAIACAVAARPAAAQSTPEGLLAQDAASTGATDVDDAKAFETAEPVEESKDATELEVSAGGLFSAGNSESVAVTSAARFRLRRNKNQLSAGAAVNYARSSPSDDDPMETTVQNLQGKLRYDRFLTESLAAFLGATARRDRFQGLDLRLNIDPGLAYYFIDKEKHRLWSEAGYDVQYDVRRDEDIAAALPEVVDKTETRHNARLFVGYDNALNERVTFNTGLEYIQTLQREKTENLRLNWDVGLTANIAGQLATATTFSLRYDNNPLPEIKKTDAVTAISLVYTFL